MAAASINKKIKRKRKLKPDLFKPENSNPFRSKRPRFKWITILWLK